MTFEKLGDIALITPGTSPKGDLINSTGLGLPFFQGSKEFKELYPVPERYTEHPVKVANSGDVLISVRAPVGEVNFAREDCSIGRGVMSVRAKKKSEQMFIFYFLKNLQGRWDSLGSTGSVFENLSTNALNSVDLPSELNREAIGEILFNIDIKIASNNALSKTLEDIAQTIFKSWFIDFNPVKTKMAGEKLAGMETAIASLFPDSMEESELGLIPKGWRVGSLGEIADLQGGYAFKSSSWTESGVPVIKIGSVKPGFVDLTQVSYVDAPTAEAIPDDYRIPAGSLVVGLTGYVGQVGLVRTHHPVPLVNQRVAKFKLKSGEWKIPFIYCFTRGEKFKGIVEELATGTAQQNVSNSQILSIPMAIPNEHIREMFDNSFKPFFQEIINLADENESLKSTRDALLPRLISGELQIPEEMLAS